MRSVFIASLLCLSTIFSAQNQTIAGKEKPVRDTKANHKVMIVPFEPKLYMSQIDRQLHEETKLEAKDIRHRFRDGLNDQLYRALKASQYSVVDLMEDTLKYKKDITSIYQFLSYEYLKVPEQDPFKPPQKEKELKSVEKGQISVETNSDRRFMNARLSNTKIVPSLYQKYKTDLFIFINQLDIFSSGFKQPGDPGEGDPLRKIVVHYTVYTFDGKLINSGIVEESFDPSLNNQKKIIDRHFSKLAAVIVQRMNKGMMR